MLTSQNRTVVSPEPLARYLEYDSIYNNLWYVDIFLFIYLFVYLINEFIYLFTYLFIYLFNIYLIYSFLFYFYFYFSVICCFFLPISLFMGDQNLISPTMFVNFTMSTRAAQQIEKTLKTYNCKQIIAKRKLVNGYYPKGLKSVSKLQIG